MSTITWTDIAIENKEKSVRLAAFKQRFGTQDEYLYLATCAAFPPVLTFDLLAKLAQNFPYPLPSFKKRITTIVADILLSQLCEPLGQGDV